MPGEEVHQIQVAHPVYLDTPMLISFLASIEDGISYSSEVAERSAIGREREGEGGGKAGIPSIVSLLGLNLSLEGRYRRKSSNEDTVESKFVREHTAASLFNRLRKQLYANNGALKVISTTVDMSSVREGDLVELQGEIVGNPLKQVIDLFATLGPYFGLSIDEPEAAAPNPPRSNRQGKAATRGRQPVPQIGSTDGTASPDLSIEEILRILKRESERSPVLDLLVEGSAGKAVLTVSRELLSADVEAYLIGGKFYVIGKVSAAVPGGDFISLIRRTVFSVGGEEMARDLFSSFPSGGDGGIDLSLARAVVEGPVLQVLPLAIYL